MEPLLSGHPFCTTTLGWLSGSCVHVLCSRLWVCAPAGLYQKPS